MNLHALPSVEQILQTRPAADLVARYGRPLTLKAIRAVLDEIRKDYSTSDQPTLPDREGILNLALTDLIEWTTPTFMPVINATGVILHTNLGRAPLSPAAGMAVQAVSQGYSNLEFDLATGKRGSRTIHVESLLQRLTGAEAALVVNNNAAAVLLILSALAGRKDVVIARSQLVEIGGGFRLPDVMKQSGAKLVEIGATNKVRLSDYEQALENGPALVLHAHHSNFKMIGFTEEPDWMGVVSLAHARSVPCVDDLGSGALLPTERYGLAHEPTVQESLTAGSDLVCFSGDKLLGGPQAGIILGKAGFIDKIRKHPLARAVRADKLSLAALSATLLHYLKGEAGREIPVWRMIATPPKELRVRARKWAGTLGCGEVLAGESTVGGGSLPGESLPTFVLALDVKNPAKFMEILRHGQPAIIARTERDRILLDPRTVLPDQDESLLAGLKNALALEIRTPTRKRG
jgi:L-seryl-tRNA(Ser) seleniumtransferase